MQHPDPIILVFLISQLLLGLVILLSGVQTLFVARRSRDWPHVPGRLTICTLSEYGTGTSDRKIYEVHVEYAYTVDGQSYSGRSIAIDYVGSNSKESQLELEKQLLKYPWLKVRYNPEDPADANLSCDIHRGLLVPVLFGLLLIVTAVGIIGLSYSKNISSQAIVDSIATTLSEHEKKAQ